MKTPQELNKIYNRLPKEKIELSSVSEVELSSISELKQIQGRMNNMNASTNARFGKAEKNIKAIVNAKENVRDSIRDMDDNIVSAQEIIKQGKTALSSFKKMAKELGLDATSSKEYKELDITVTNDMVDIVNDSKEVLKELKSYAK
tara:strand:+ start:708 stop:1145 length:438 start_codon:yes stop_codon:yes gene_type:complete